MGKWVKSNFGVRVLTNLGSVGVPMRCKEFSTVVTLFSKFIGNVILGRPIASSVGDRSKE